MQAEAVHVHSESKDITATAYLGDDPRRINAAKDSGTDSQWRRLGRVVDKLRTLLTPEEQERLLSRIDQAETTPQASAAEASFVAALSGGRTMTALEAAALEAAAFMQYFQHRRALLEGALTASQVADILGTTRQAPHHRLRRGLLLAVMDRGAWRFPRWQFDPEGPDGVVRGLPEVLSALHVSPLAKVRWLTSPNAYLDGMAPLDLLKRGDTARVLAEARSVGLR